MGVFRVSCRIEQVSRRGRSAAVPGMLVDTGSEYTWVPAGLLEKLGVRREKKDVQFIMANGTAVTRAVGFAVVRVDGQFTVDEVVFGEPGDLALLGARSLAGLALVVDPRRRRLVAAGPIPAAGAADGDYPKPPSR